MAEREMTTVQCFEDDKQVFLHAAEVLRWTMPQVQALAAEAIARLVADEETVEQRRGRLLGKLDAGSTSVRQVSHRSRTPVASESHTGTGLVEVAS